MGAFSCNGSEAGFFQQCGGFFQAFGLAQPRHPQAHRGFDLFFHRKAVRFVCCLRGQLWEIGDPGPRFRGAAPSHFPEGRLANAGKQFKQRAFA